MSQTEPTPRPVQPEAPRYQPQPVPRTAVYERPVTERRNPLSGATKLLLFIVGGLVIALTFFAIGVGFGHATADSSRGGYGYNQPYSGGQQGRSQQGFGQNGQGTRQFGNGGQGTKSQQGGAVVPQAPGAANQDGSGTASSGVATPGTAG